MTATYNADNTITELPGMEKPAPPFVSTVGSQVIYQREIDIYNAAVAKCRTIPCSPSCRGLWKVGQVLEEGRDYGIKGAGDWKWCYSLEGNIFAAPVVPTPASIEDEAEGLYPEPTGRMRERPYSVYEIADIRRDTHITCARMYLSRLAEKDGEIEGLKAQLQAIKEEHDFKNKPLM